MKSVADVTVKVEAAATKLFGVAMVTLRGLAEKFANPKLDAASKVGSVASTFVSSCGPPDILSPMDEVAISPNRAWTADSLNPCALAN